MSADNREPHRESEGRNATSSPCHCYSGTMLSVRVLHDNRGALVAAAAAKAAAPRPTMDNKFCGKP